LKDVFLVAVVGEQPVVIAVAEQEVLVVAAVVGV
jgi:hypothetical protein